MQIPADKALAKGFLLFLEVEELRRENEAKDEALKQANQEVLRLQEELEQAKKPTRKRAPKGTSDGKTG